MKKILILTTILPLLMSSSGSTNYNELKYHSSILNDDTYIYKLLKSGTIKEICPSHILNNEAASIQVTYEFFEKHKDYAPYNGYKLSYHLIYQMDIFLSSNVHYKGGIGNWFDGYNPAYINSLKVTTNVKSTKFDNKTKLKATPHELENDNTIDYRFAITKEIEPTSQRFGSSYYNYLSEDNVGFDANNGYISTSYNTKWSDGLVYQDFNVYNNRLVAYLTSEQTKTSTDLTYITSYKYGMHLENNGDNQLIIKRDDNGKLIFDDLYSGPNKGGNNFKFTIFGAFNIQNDYDITNMTTKIELNTSHGSTTIRDTFSSTATINLKLI